MLPVSWRNLTGSGKMLMPKLSKCMSVCTTESTKIIVPTSWKKTTFELVYANEEVKRVTKQSKDDDVLPYEGRYDGRVGEQRPNQTASGAWWYSSTLRKWSFMLCSAHLVRQRIFPGQCSEFIFRKNLSPIWSLTTSFCQKRYGNQHGWSLERYL